MTCPACGGRRHVRVNGAWERCTCLTETLHSVFIKSVIKKGEAMYPASFDALVPLDFCDLALTGSYDNFRYRVWRSLVHHKMEREDLTFEYTDISRLAEVYFGRDGEYKTLYEMRGIGLLILLMGVMELPPNTFTGPIIAQVITLRQHENRPTWVYVRHPERAALVRAYSPEVADLLLPLLMTDPSRSKPEEPTSAPEGEPVTAASTPPPQSSGGRFDPMQPIRR